MINTSPFSFKSKVENILDRYANEGYIHRNFEVLGCHDSQTICVVIEDAVSNGAESAFRGFVARIGDAFKCIVLNVEVRGNFAVFHLTTDMKAESLTLGDKWNTATHAIQSISEAALKLFGVNEILELSTSITLKGQAEFIVKKVQEYLEVRLPKGYTVQRMRNGEGTTLQLEVTDSTTHIR